MFHLFLFSRFRLACAKGTFKSQPCLFMPYVQIKPKTQKDAITTKKKPDLQLPSFKTCFPTPNAYNSGNNNVRSTSQSVFHAETIQTPVIYKRNHVHEVERREREYSRRRSIEISYAGAKVLAGAEILVIARVVLAALLRDLVAPPVKIDFGVLQAEEDDDAGNGNAT